MTAPKIGEREAPELLPCPFCGARAEVYYGSDLSKYPGMVSIECAQANTDNDEEFEASEGCYIQPRTGWYRTEDEAAIAWNQRVIIAKHFPEDDSWVERAAEEIWCESTARGHVTQERAIEIINRCRRG